MKSLKYKLLSGVAITIGIIGLCAIMYGLNGQYEKALAQKKIEAEKVAEQKKKDAIENMINSVVMVAYCRDDKDHRTCASATGFAIKSDAEGTWILTNKHVCMIRMDTQLPKNSDGVYLFHFFATVARHESGKPAYVVKIGQNTDLCLLRSMSRTKSVLKLAPEIKYNEKVATFGFPSGQPTLKQGHFLGVAPRGEHFFAITDTKGWYGASGSPFINEKGELVAVMAAIAFHGVENPTVEDVYESHAVPLEIVREFISGVVR